MKSNELETFNTFVKIFERSVSRHKNNPVIFEHTAYGQKVTTYSELLRDVQSFAAALIRGGFRKGDRIALLAEGRKEWLVVTLAMQYVGIICVPISRLSDSQEINEGLRYLSPKAVIISVDEAKKMQDSIESLTSNIIIFDKDIWVRQRENYTLGDNWIDYKGMLSEGERFLYTEAGKEQLETTKRRIVGSDIAYIEFTSGRTGRPKPVCLSQRNISANVIQTCFRMHLLPSDKAISVLPWDHPYMLVGNVFSMIYYGASIVIPENKLQSIRRPWRLGEARTSSAYTREDFLLGVAKAMRQSKVTILLTVPSVAEGIRSVIIEQISKKGKLYSELFDLLLHASKTYIGNGNNIGKGWRLFLRPIHLLGDVLFYKKIREELGGKLKHFICGGHAMNRDLERFFYAIGMPAMAGYGLTEASPFVSTNTYGSCKIGTVGKPIGFIDVRIADAHGRTVAEGDEGEILVKGENVMDGYWHDTDATDRVIIDGWLHTADRGFFDKDGFLTISQSSNH